MNGYEGALLNTAKDSLVNDVAPAGMGFLYDPSVENGRKFSKGLGSVYGSVAGGLLGGPVGAMVGNFVGDLGAGALFDLGQYFKKRSFPK